MKHYLADCVRDGAITYNDMLTRLKEYDRKAKNVRRTKKSGYDELLDAAVETCVYLSNNCSKSPVLEKLVAAIRKAKGA